jgi:hypothetical protein
MMVKQQPKKKVGFVYLILGAVAAIGIAMGLFFSTHPLGLVSKLETQIMCTARSGSCPTCRT